MKEKPVETGEIISPQEQWFRVLVSQSPAAPNLVYDQLGRTGYDPYAFGVAALRTLDVLGHYKNYDHELRTEWFKLQEKAKGETDPAKIQMLVGEIYYIEGIENTITWPSDIYDRSKEEGWRKLTQKFTAQALTEYKNLAQILRDLKPQDPDAASNVPLPEDHATVKIPLIIREELPAAVVQARLNNFDGEITSNYRRFKDSREDYDESKLDTGTIENIRNNPNRKFPLSAEVDEFLEKYPVERRIGEILASAKRWEYMAADTYRRWLKVSHVKRAQEPPHIWELRMGKSVPLNLQYPAVPAISKH